MPDGGQIQIISSDARVMVGGMKVATMADQFLIVGCAFTVPPGKPQPCMRVQWTVPAVEGDGEFPAGDSAYQRRPLF